MLGTHIYHALHFLFHEWKAGGAVGAGAGLLLASVIGVSKDTLGIPDE